MTAKPSSLKTVSQLFQSASVSANKTCLVIGNGPSLREVPLDILKSYPTFGSNGIFYMQQDRGFHPTYHVVEDNKVFEENFNEIARYSGPIKIYPKEYCDKLDSSQYDYSFDLDQGFYNRKHPFYAIPRFNSSGKDIIFAGQSVTIVILQIAFNLGFRNVYLLGMDFSYKTDHANVKEMGNNHIVSQGDDPNHFHPSYFGKGKTWKDPRLNRVLRSYFLAKNVYEAHGGCIYNATFGGKLEIFERFTLN